MTAFIPFASGALGAALAGAVMVATGMIRERGTSATALIAIAAFWPVFAIAAGEGVALHLVVFAAFSALGVLGYSRGLSLIAIGLILHGLFDLIVGHAGHPGPDFWPSFCAGVDVTLGAILLVAIQRNLAQ